MSSSDDLDEFNSIIEKGEQERSSHAVSRTGATPSETQNESGNVSTDDITMWAIYSGGKIFRPCERAVNTIPSGQYTIEKHPDLGVIFSKNNVNLDELLILPDSASEEVIKSITYFWSREEHFRRLKFLWKRGILLWGPPGSGKTSTLQVVSKQIIDNGGISVYVTNPQLAAKGLELLRRVEPKRPIVVMLEDVDAIVDTYGEADLLALLDGEQQIDNVVYIATTNYPELLDKRLVNRPSRFDIVIKIGMPSSEARQTYLKLKNPRLAKNTLELNKWVELTKDLSIAHIKELIVSVEVFGSSVDTAAKRLRIMNGIKLDSSSKEDGQFGFSK